MRLQRFQQVRKDLRDLTPADLEGFDAVVHLAALSNDPLGNLDSQLTYDINHLASVKLATLAKEAGVTRFVFSSSCSTYGAAGDAFRMKVRRSTLSLLMASRKFLLNAI